MVVGLAPVFISLIANWLLGHYGISNTFLAFGTGIIGFCYGTCPTCFHWLSLIFMAPKILVAITVYYLQHGGALALLGPVIAGLAVDMTGTYSIAYMISAALLCGAFLLSMSIKEQRQLKNIIGEVALEDSQF